MKSVRKVGSYKGKSNALGMGGRAKQLSDAGVPGGVIGNLARKAQAAPGQKNFHKGGKSSGSTGSVGMSPKSKASREKRLSKAGY
jgi:hypothetical protein